MNIHTLGHPGRGNARDDVVVGDQHVRWEEVGGLGESGVGLEGTRQDTTRDGHHVLGIWSCEKRSLNGQSHAYARTRTRTHAHTHTHTRLTRPRVSHGVECPGAPLVQCQPHPLTPYH